MAPSLKVVTVKRKRSKIKYDLLMMETKQKIKSQTKKTKKQLKKVPDATSLSRWQIKFVIW